MDRLATRSNPPAGGSRPAATRRDAAPCGSGLRCASSWTLSIGPRRAGSQFCVCNGVSKGVFSNVRQRQLPPGASPPAGGSRALP